MLLPPRLTRTFVVSAAALGVWTGCGSSSATEHLAFSTQPPANIQSEERFPDPLYILVLDSEGHRVVAYDSHVLLMLDDRAAVNPAELLGTPLLDMTEGVAKFTDLRVKSLGGHFGLIASAPDLENVESNFFDVGPTKIVFSTQPKNTPEGAVLAPVVLTALSSQVDEVELYLDRGGNVSELDGTTIVPVVNGVASFTDLSSRPVAYGLKLVALPSFEGESAGESVTSDPFDILPAPAVAFTVQPATAPAGTVLPLVEVTALKAEVTVVILGLATNPEGSTLTGTTAKSVVGGVAQFTDLRIDRPALGLTLVALPSFGAGSAGLPVSSAPFDITGAHTVLATVDGGDVVPSGGNATLDCSVTNAGSSSFDYAWHGYRDDGAPSPGPFVLSSDVGPQVTATLTFPTADFYFFCVVTDPGLPLNDPNRTTSAYVLVHESDGPVGRFTLSPALPHIGQDVTADASTSTGFVTTLSWAVEQYTGTRTPDAGLEGYLSLYDATNIVWSEVFSVDAPSTTVTIPAARFPSAGVYRVRLEVFDADADPHTSYQYLTLLP